MTANERAAATRIFIDLIKADKVIDRGEMELYRRLREEHSITRREEAAAYGMTLGQAVEILGKAPQELRRRLMAVYEALALSDGACSREEALLIAALRYCLGSDDEEGDIISAHVDGVWFEADQALYVESRRSEKVNAAIERDYRSISRELAACGFEFVYIPAIARHWLETDFGFLSEVVGMLAPAMSGEAVASLVTTIRELSTGKFCVEQLHHKLGFPGMGDTDPALLLRVGESRVGEKIFTNFLRIRLSDDVALTVRMFADRFLPLLSERKATVRVCGNESGQFLYSGFYRQLFEILTLRKSVTCHLLVDFVHNKLRFPEIDMMLAPLHRKEKALYVLFVHEIRNGGVSFTPPASGALMQKYTRRMERLQAKYRRVYAAFGGNEAETPDITVPENRRPMISVIRRAVDSLGEAVHNAGLFKIIRDQRGVYGIGAAPSAFICRDFSGDASPRNIFDSELFRSLKEMD